jgi:hypothetical protein
LKAVVFEIAGDFKIDGQSITINDYIIFIYNKGIWECYGFLKPREL